MEKTMGNKREDKFIIIIPARYGSSRFPGKPLASIAGREMILRVCDRCAQTGIRVVVATDDLRIKECVETGGYEVVMTRGDHNSGTERVYEAYCKLGQPAEIVINVQGDEPFISPSQIEALRDCFISSQSVGIATLIREFDKSKGFEALFDSNVVKVTRNVKGEALYFSRSIIPYVRGVNWQEWLDTTRFHTHVGIYGYTGGTLGKIVALPRSPLEIAENLEQLRWLENGFRINTVTTDIPTFGIDTPSDLKAAEEYLSSME